MARGRYPARRPEGVYRARLYAGVIALEASRAAGAQWHDRVTMLAVDPKWREAALDEALALYAEYVEASCWAEHASDA